MNLTPNPHSVRDRYSEETVHLIACRVDGKLYGLDIMQVHRVLIPGTIVKVPGADPLVEGMIDQQGSLIPVFQLRRLLDPRATSGDNSRIIIVYASDGLLAIFVDQVAELIRLARSAILPRPEAISTRVITGAFYLEKELGLLIDLSDLSSGDSRLSPATL